MVEAEVVVAELDLNHADFEILHPLHHEDEAHIEDLRLVAKLTLTFPMLVEVIELMDEADRPPDPHLDLLLRGSAVTAAHLDLLHSKSLHLADVSSHTVQHAEQGSLITCDPDPLAQIHHMHILREGKTYEEISPAAVAEVEALHASSAEDEVIPVLVHDQALHRIDAITPEYAEDRALGYLMESLTDAMFSKLARSAMQHD